MTACKIALARASSGPLVGRVRRATVLLLLPVSTLHARVLTPSRPRTSRSSRVSTTRPLRACPGPSDQAGKELVREESAACRQADPRIVGFLEQSGRHGPIEGVHELRLEERRERDPAIEPEPEDQALDDGRGRVQDLLAPGWPAGRATAGRQQGCDVAVESGGIPAPDLAVERVGSRADRLD